MAVPARLALRSTIAVLLAGSALLPGPASSFDELTPSIVPFTPSVSTADYSTIDYGETGAPTDDRFATTTWRIAEGTGNCCETYLTTTRSGRLLDFGGRFVHFSDDRGMTWSRVQPILPLVEGEGAIVSAPGGDVLGVEWDAFGGDHLQFYKYEATTGAWRYTEMPLHQPFYDREWIAVVPGPITVEGATHEYVSFVKGGVPDEVWFYSTDGLHYHRVTSKWLEQMLEGREVEAPLATTSNPDGDWVQPNTNMGLAPLGRSGALARGELFLPWALLDGDPFEWSAYRFPDGPDADEDGDQPSGLFQVDSAGVVHNVLPVATAFTYRTSSDGGTTWSETLVELPDHQRIEKIDFRANRLAGIAAVAIHAEDASTTSDQDLVYKLDIGGASARVVRLYEVGLGDVDATAGTQQYPRFDFESVAIFDDGRVAVSFIDSTTNLRDVLSTVDDFEPLAPAVAIELTTELGGPVPEEPPPALGEPYASYTFDQGPEGWTSTGLPTTWQRTSPGTKTGTDDPSTASYGIEGPTQYVDNVSATLTSPPIATNAGRAVLEFWLKHDLEYGWDFVNAEWSRDGTNWLPLESFTGRNAAYPNWRKVTSGFQSPGGDVLVRFAFSSDPLCSSSVLSPSRFCAGNWNGVRVDEVIVGAQAT